MSAADMYVYLFAVSDDGPCKVGISKDPDRRLKAFLEMGHFNLRMVCSWSSSFARSIEMAAHKALASQRIAGEWFAVQVSQAMDTVDRFHRGFESGQMKKLGGREASSAHPSEVAKANNKSSVQKQQAAISERLQSIRDEWLLGTERTAVLLANAGVCYAAARKQLGPRRKYIRREQPSLLVEAARIWKRAEAEKARTEKACALIADRWTSLAPRTDDLLAEAGVSINTAIKYLGKRPDGRSRPRRRKSNWIGPAFASMAASR